MEDLTKTVQELVLLAAEIPGLHSAVLPGLLSCRSESILAPSVPRIHRVPDSFIMTIHHSNSGQRRGDCVSKCVLTDMPHNTYSRPVLHTSDAPSTNYTTSQSLLLFHLFYVSKECSYQREHFQLKRKTPTYTSFTQSHTCIDNAVLRS